MPEPEPRRLLILGGTAEARALADAVVRRFGTRLAVTTSLAGRTVQAAALAGAVRSGGFGGAEGLASYLDAARIDLVVDATHPFATRISDAAKTACARRHLPLLSLQRAPWQPAPGDRWIEVADAADAARVLPSTGERPFLAIGVRGLDAFAGLARIHFLVRLIDPPAAPLPLADCELILGRGPFDLASERRILARHRIDVLVTKASGGAATKAKLEAARERGIPVVMLRRPQTAGEEIGVGAALLWLAERVGKAEEVTS